MKASGWIILTRLNLIVVSLNVVDLMYDREVPVFYFDPEDVTNIDRERVFEKLSLNYSDEFLKFCTKDLNLTYLETKYKLMKVCEEEGSVSKSEFLEEAEVEKDDFYTGRLN